MKPSKTLRSELGWSTPDRITVRGKDLPNEILGHLNLGDMAFLELTGRAPNPKESKLFNAMVVTLVEHGITPSALAARLTYLGAPEALQGAVAAGLLGLGSVFVGSMEGVARILSDAVETGKDAKSVLAENRRMPGLGHPIHKPVDPRTRAALRARARDRLLRQVLQAHGSDRRGEEHHPERHRRDRRARLRARPRLEDREGPRRDGARHRPRRPHPRGNARARWRPKSGTAWKKKRRGI